MSGLFDSKAALGVAACVVLVGVVAIGCGKGSETAAAPPPQPARAGGPGGWGSRPAATPIVAARVVRGPIGAQLRPSGRLAAAQTVPITAQLSGLLAEVRVDVGDTVQAGEIVARFDTRELTHRHEQARLDRLEAEARARRSALLETKAGTDYERAKKLFEEGLETDDSIYSREEVEGFEHTHKLATVDREIADLTAQGAAVSEQDLLEQLALAEVRSPTSGVIVARLVRAYDSATNGAVLFEVLDPADLELVVRVTESEAERIFVGQPAQVFGQARTPFVYPARVRRVAPTVDVENGLVEVRIAVAPWTEMQMLAVYANTQRIGRMLGPLAGLAPSFPFPAPAAAPPLRPGMFVAAEVTIAQHRDAVLVPKTAIQYDRDQPFVFVVETGFARRRDLRVDPEFATENVLEVLAGLDGGEIVVVRQSDLRDGVPVTVTNAAALGLSEADRVGDRPRGRPSQPRGGGNDGGGRPSRRGGNPGGH